MKNDDPDNKLIEASIARVQGAVRVASEAVSTAMAIKNEAVDKVEAMRTSSNDKGNNQAIKKMQTETKNGITNKNI